MKRKISLVLPVYNEKDSLNKFVISLARFTSKIKKFKFEIIISDSHSTDGTVTIAKSLARKFKNVHYINVGAGIGTGIYQGHMYAHKKFNPDIFIQIDADGQVDKRIIVDLIKEIDNGHGFAFGSRFIKGGRNNLSILRKLFSWGSSFFCRIVIGPLSVKEFTNSARAFSKQTFKKIRWSRLPIQNKSFVFLPALLNEAIMTGHTYKEIPLVFNDRHSGYSKNKVFHYMVDLILYGVKVRVERSRNK